MRVGVDDEVGYLWRAVDCNTRQPVDARAGAAARTSTKHGDGDANTNNNNGAEDTGSGGGGGGGGTARSISVYSDGPSPGWNWMVYGDQWAIPVRPGFGAGGSTAGRTLNTPYSSPQPPPKHPLTTPQTPPKLAVPADPGRRVHQRAARRAGGALVHPLPGDPQALRGREAQVETC